MPDYSKAIWMPNNNCFPDTGKKSFIILHGTAGGNSAQEIANYFKGTEGSANPVSSHYIVGKDGIVVQCVAEKDGSFGNGVVNNPNWTGNPNYYTISIEHVKSTSDNSETLTPAQQAASFALIKNICQRNGIGMHDADDTTGITSHAAIDPVNRARCPGTFDWDALWTYLNGGNTPMTTIPQNWTDDGTTLKSPDGTPVVLGFRDHVLNSNWDPANVPLEAEHHDLILEQSNPSLVAGQSQMFRWKRLEYTPKQGVFEGWLGQELLWYQKNYAELLAKVADLQQQLNKDTQAQEIAQLQDENAKLKALLASSNIGQISTLGKQIQDDIALIVKLSQVD